ncbi:RDD family protein [Niabella hibiscisoli]|uniref:RDD family protein n=1 Tax=Niabella hibiscisoli TaxID=1825928 RepID=UPI001F0F2EA1|nr:RDD family protein [Niabella hibiscisoli]MCH5714879.1 RDD family protein [Niabella hibiscisoli]
MEEMQSNLFDENYEFTPASTGKRFINYVIDFAAFYALCYVSGILLAILAPGLFTSENQTTFVSYLVAIVLILAYYTVLEGSTGKSLGKMLTGTKVVTEEGHKITYRDAFLRALSRLVPFEALSIFLGSGMWHDRWTQTRVVEAG